MRVADRTWIRRLTTSSQNPGHRPTPHPHKQAPPPPGRRSIHDPGGTGARFCRNLRIRAEGTLGCSEVQAPDLRGHWVYRSESGVGSVLILRLRHARRTGQQILVKSSGAPHKTFIFMPRVTANTSPATLPMALVGPRPGQLSLARCPAPTHHARPHLPRSPDPVHTMRPRDRATTPRPATGPDQTADRPRQAPDGTSCADRPLAPVGHEDDRSRTGRLRKPPVLPRASR